MIKKTTEIDAILLNLNKAIDAHYQWLVSMFHSVVARDASKPEITDNHSYGLYIYKNLFTFNKNDRLDITVYDRMDYYGVFEASFDVIHDKNPIKFVFDGDFGEITYGTFLRVK